MTREIKFRARSIDEGYNYGKWIVSRCIVQDKTGRMFFVDPDVSEGGYVNYISGFVDDAVEVDPVSLGQFTGLHDATKWDELTPAEKLESIRNGVKEKDWKGREVYEGDILRGKWNASYPDVSGPVLFQNGAFKARIELLGSTGIASDFSKFRVIGTIHDPKPEKA